METAERTLTGQRVAEPRRGRAMSNGTQDIPRFQLAPQQEHVFLLRGDAAVTQAVVFPANRVSEAHLRAALDGLVSRGQQDRADRLA